MLRSKMFLFFVVLVAGSPLCQAGQLIKLPTTLDQLIIPGNYTVTGTEPDTFSNFSYSMSPVNTAPTAADVTVSAFSAGKENGITFSGAFFAPANTTVDYTITYQVTAPKGDLLTDATLSGTGTVFGGTGVTGVSETILNAANGAALGSMNIVVPGGPLSDTISFAGVQSILVEKDMVLVGGSLGASISVINQGFSSSSVPEPASVALLSIGMTGLLVFRRLLRKRKI